MPVAVVAIMEALTERDVTVLFKADAERMAERASLGLSPPVERRYARTSVGQPMPRLWSDAAQCACPACVSWVFVP